MLVWSDSRCWYGVILDVGMEWSAAPFYKGFIRGQNLLNGQKWPCRLNCHIAHSVHFDHASTLPDHTKRLKDKMFLQLISTQVGLHRNIFCMSKDVSKLLSPFFQSVDRQVGFYGYTIICWPDCYNSSQTWILSSLHM